MRINYVYIDKSTVVYRSASSIKEAKSKLGEILINKIEKLTKEKYPEIVIVGLSEKGKKEWKQMSSYSLSGEILWGFEVTCGYYWGIFFIELLKDDEIKEREMEEVLI